MPSHHLITGGQRSGKSRHAERLGLRWLAQSDAHSVTVLATAVASDDEMRERIARHRADRPDGFETVEAPVHLGAALRAASAPGRLLIVDCLTLWLVNALMPMHVQEHASSPVSAAAVRAVWSDLRMDFLSALDEELASPVLLVSNEIGCGVIPMGAEVRQFVDELGRLNQDVAQCCAQLTLMVAGQPFTKAVEKWA